MILKSKRDYISITPGVYEFLDSVFFVTVESIVKVNSNELVSINSPFETTDSFIAELHKATSCHDSKWHNKYRELQRNIITPILSNAKAMDY